MTSAPGSLLSRPTVCSIISNVQNHLLSPPIQLIHSLNTSWPRKSSVPSSSTLRVGVLDSSFNPPTLAHLALAKSRLPSGENHDATLLLLSVRNSDKTPKPTDATFYQRLEMMALLAQELGGNTAIAIIDEPLFFRKGVILSSFLRHRLNAVSNNLGDKTANPQFSLYFILGLDTLERVLSPKYYVPGGDFSPSSPESIQAMRDALIAFVSDGPGGTNCRMLCARRDPTSHPTLSIDEALLSPISYAQDLFESGKIAMFEIGDIQQGLSSSTVRTLISSGDSDEWWKMVPASIADYIRRQRLYEGHTDDDLQ